MAENLLTPDDVNFVKNLLRQGSVKWKGRSECLKRARKRVRVGETKTGKAVWKFYWQCAACSEWFRNEKQMEVDHIEEIGPFKGCWTDYINRVFCSQDNLQALCVACHMKKTTRYNNATIRWKRKTGPMSAP